MRDKPLCSLLYVEPILVYACGMNRLATELISSNRIIVSIFQCKELQLSKKKPQQSTTMTFKVNKSFKR